MSGPSCFFIKLRILHKNLRIFVTEGEKTFNLEICSMKLWWTWWYCNDTCYGLSFRNNSHHFIKQLLAGTHSWIECNYVTMKSQVNLMISQPTCRKFVSSEGLHTVAIIQYGVQVYIWKIVCVVWSIHPFDKSCQLHTCGMYHTAMHTPE